MLTETAYAKLNLALHVRRRREDGYHEIETLFAFCTDGDVLSIEEAPDFSLSITGPFAEGLSADQDNLVLLAARSLAAAHGVKQGARFHLDKRLPIASGIGGGSADAAAALRLSARLWGLEGDFGSIAAALGADVPACVTSQTCVGTGVGEQLEPISIAGLSGTPVLLVNPLVACQTGPVFKAWYGQDLGALDSPNWVNSRNDLQPPAMSLVPEIADVLALLAAQPGAVATRMSGSGATCFALFKLGNARDEAARVIAAAYPEWWVLPTAIR
jgi:4-diphosphocytidyl-2-C-methyl-D-erythritol kinase